MVDNYAFKNMQKLTLKQEKVFLLLCAFVKKQGKAPTLVELQKLLRENGMRAASRRSVTQYLEALEQKGLIIRINEPRGIRIIQQDSNLARIPILGAANAGTAKLFADEYVVGFLRVSEKFLAKKKNVFALEVQGNSLNQANIGGNQVEEGDWVIIDKDYIQPKDGDYVLSIIDGVANLKRFYFNQQQGQILLISESTENHPPIVIHPDDQYLIGGKIILVVKKVKKVDAAS
jgi:SOS regulatory protein LexA